MKQYIIIGIIIAIALGIFYVNQVRLENALIEIETLEQENQLLNDTLLEIDRQSTIINRNTTVLNERKTEIQRAIPRVDIQDFDNKPTPELQQEVQDFMDNTFRRLEGVTQ